MEIYEIIFKIIHVCLFSAGVFFNGVLIGLILFKTPKAFRPYSVLIFNHAITDLVGCVADFSIQARVIPTGTTLAYICNGFCQYVSPQLCAVAMALQLHSYSHSLYLLLICFTYRYLIIIRKVPSIKILLCAISTAWIPSIVQTICFILEDSDSETIGKIVMAHRPHHNLEGKLFGGYVSLSRPLTGYAIFHLTMSPTPIYTAILILRKKIIGVLNISACHMREQTKKMHRQLLKALTIQALLPTLNVAAVIMYFLILFDILDSPIVECTNLVVVQFVPTTTPLLSLFYIKPYREAITNFFDRNFMRRGTKYGSEKASSTSCVQENTSGVPERLVSSTFI